MDINKKLREKIKDKTVTVGVIGLGYVGLPLMHSMCMKGLKVIGFDVDALKVEKLNAGKSYLHTIPDAWIADPLANNLFEPTDDFSRLNEPDILLICVPTPLNEDREPDLSYVENVAFDISKVLRSGQMIVLESTTYPGTTNDIVRPILEKSGLVSQQDFYLAYSPEREDPGNPDFETSTTPKIIGGDGAEALDLACRFYDIFVSMTVPVSDLATAEAVKITENVFRAVNIALVNELKLIYSKMGIDVWDVIDAAKTKPFGYMPFYPGPGLGGHCIPIDPFYLTWRARDFDIETRFIELAGEINTNMPQHVVEQTASALSLQAQKLMRDSKVLIVGVAYKKNINDQRESPAFTVIKLLEEQGATVDYYDPYIPQITALRDFPEIVGRDSIVWDSGDLSNYDAVLIITDHDNIPYEDIVNNARLIIDTRNALKDFSDSTHIFKA